MQPIEIYNDRYIVYSLANFCFGGNKRPADFDTAIYRQEFIFDRDGSLVSIRAPEIIPYSISSSGSVNDYRPTPAEDGAKERIFAKLDYSPVTAEVMDLSVDKNEMVRLDTVIKDIVVDLKYASSDNIVGKPVYDSNIAWLRRGTANKLKKANDALMKQGYRIKVWDAYRSEEDHSLLFEAAKNNYYFLDPGSAPTIRGGWSMLPLWMPKGTNSTCPANMTRCPKKHTGLTGWLRLNRRGML